VIYRRPFISVCLFVPALTLFAVEPASADSINIVGNNLGSLATAVENSTFNPATNVFTFTLTNTSPFDARITGLGFDLVGGDFSGNSSSGLNGFSGTNMNGFTFSDGGLGNVPQFNSAVLDFGDVTSNSGNFSGGSPNDGIAPGDSLVFSVSGPFTGFTDSSIANSIFVRFQRVGADGEGSDVGRPGTPPPPAVPEPASLTLIGSGLIGVAAGIRRRRRQQGRGASCS
jgi:hypothetical protein